MGSWSRFSVSKQVLKTSVMLISMLQVYAAAEVVALYGVDAADKLEAVEQESPDLNAVADTSIKAVDPQCETMAPPPPPPPASNDTCPGTTPSPSPPPPPVASCGGMCSQIASGAASNSYNENWQCCGSRCIDLFTSFTNCGACGNHCDWGSACCLGGCCNLNNDPSNCGAVGRFCPAGVPCTFGLCGYAI